MNLSNQIAKNFREVYFGKNWTWSNMKEQLEDVTWKEANINIHDFNTISALTYHIHYYVSEVLKVLKGGELEAKDKFSFDHPPINSKEDWDLLLKNMWKEGEAFSNCIEKLPDDKFWTIMKDEKWGNYYRNICGIIEHTHYHLGQIVIIKKLIRKSSY